MSSTGGRRSIDYLKEAAVIVGSILLAFVVDAAWDNRLEVGRVNAALSSLAEEIAIDKAELETAIGRSQSRIDDLRRFLELSPDEIEALPVDSLPQLDWLRPPSTFDAVGAALESFFVGGNLNSVADAELRSALLEWAQFPEEIEKDWELARASVLALREHEVGHGASVSLSARRIPIPGARPYTSALASMRRDAEVVGTAVQLLRDYGTYLGALQEGPRIADQLLDAIAR